MGLPIEYQKVEYIESTGTQYIDSKISLERIYGYEIEFESTGFIPNSQNVNGIIGTNNVGNDLKLWQRKNWR